MSKVKQTPVPLPGSFSKSQRSTSRAPSKVAVKSEEFIHSSDDSSNEAEAPAKPSAKPLKKQPTTEIAIHKPNGTTKKTEIPIREQKVAPKKKIVTKELGTSSSPDDSDGAAKSQKDLPQKKGVENTAAGDSESESEPASSSDTSSDDFDDETAPAAAQNTEIEPTQSQAPQQTHTVEFRPALPYVPPKGFAAVPTPLRTTSEAAQLFQNLDGKQVWHITAPAGVPLSEIQQIAMGKALEGEPVLNYRNSDYGLTSGDGSEEGARAVLVPQQNGYKSVAVPISQTFHVQQVLRLPKLSSLQADPSKGSETVASITRSTIRAPRPQIKGLKMRFHLSAFGDQAPGTIGQSDDEDDAPNGSRASKKAEKRKHAELNGDDAPTKKAKKHKSSEEALSKEERRSKKEKRRKEKEHNKAKS